MCIEHQLFKKLFLEGRSPKSCENNFQIQESLVVEPDPKFLGLGLGLGSGWATLSKPKPQKLLGLGLGRLGLENNSWNSDLLNKLHIINRLKSIWKKQSTWKSISRVDSKFQPTFAKSRVDRRVDFANRLDLLWPNSKKCLYSHLN